MAIEPSAVMMNEAFDLSKGISNHDVVTQFLLCPPTVQPGGTNLLDLVKLIDSVAFGSMM